MGTDESDWILGTEGDDIICALGGDDIIQALAGNDVVLSGPGTDLVDLGGGNSVHEDESELDRTVDNEELRSILSEKSITDLPSQGVSPADSGAPRLVDGAEQPPVVDLDTVDRASAEAFRQSLGFEQRPWRALGDAATSNESLVTYGAPFTDDEMAELDRRRELELQAADYLADIEGHPWYSGHYLDHRGGGRIVVNAPVDQVAKARTELNQHQITAGDVLIQPVSASIDEIDLLVGDTVRAAAEHADQLGGALEISFDPSQFRYMVHLITDDDSDLDPSLLQEMLDTHSDYLEFTGVKQPTDLASPICDFADCHIIEPALIMARATAWNQFEFCSVGWIVVRGGVLKVLSADHCQQSHYYTRVNRNGTTSANYLINESVRLDRHGGSSYGEYSTSRGVDARLFDIVDNGRNGLADNEALNAVLKISYRHSDLVREVASASSAYPRNQSYSVGSILCLQGKTRLSKGWVPSCGQVTSLGDLGSGAFASGFVEINARACEGDSGGPVWAPGGGTQTAWSRSAEAAAGIINGGYNPDSSGCSTGGATASDMGRSLADTGSALFVPSGHLTSRRIAIRWYDIFSNHSPDTGGLNYWSGQSCQGNNGNLPADMAYVFTVTGASAFKNRYPLSSLYNSKLRVRALYQGLFDRNATSGDESYWGGFIYGSSGSSLADREARYDYVAWQFIVNTQFEFDNRYSSYGANGSPPWCSMG